MRNGGFRAGTRRRSAKEGFQTCPSRWRLEMTTDLEALVIAGYVFADEYPVPARPGRPATVSDAELVALAVCQAAMAICSDRQFLGLVARVLPGWFPQLPSQSQYNRRLRALVELIAAVQQRLARIIDAGGIRLCDGTLLACASYPGCASRSEFAGFARYGYQKSQHRFLWGVRLVLLTDPRGLPLGYTLVPAGEKEYEPLADLLTGTPSEIVIADEGLWGRGYRERLAAAGVELITPARERTTGNETDERRLASVRLAQRLLALTLGILLNTLAGRPARALAAYDGR